MKRSYDLSFVDDTNDITSPIDRSLQPNATPATHSTFSLYAAAQHNSSNGGYPDTLWSGPLHELRVPLLAGAIDFGHDFQSNAALVPSNLCFENSSRDVHLFADEIQSRLTGLGIRYEGQLSAFMHPPLASSVVIPTDSIIKAAPNDLSFRDICRLDSSPIFGLKGFFEETNDEIPSGVNAYSECPIRDYTAHAPSTSSSIPSLFYPSGSEGSITDSLSIGSARGKLQDLLEYYSPPLQPGGVSEPLVGLYADINLREIAAQQQLPQFGVNPANIMGDGIHIKTEVPEPDYLPGPFPQRSLVLTHSPGPRTEHSVNVAFPGEALDAIVSVLSAAKREEDENVASVSLKPDSHFLTPVLPSAVPAFSAALQMATPSASYISPRLLTLQPRIRTPLTDVYPPQGQIQLLPATVETLDAVIDPQSPVLNAHLGIELDDLRRRADDFRRRNPGQDIDKTWLQAYAGRLSYRGEFMEDYRCYVIGCTQRNKRRDHILVHVGSHVEHRPFQCTNCGMRFLRKNECKRHESSHGGQKPFRCTICAPSQNRSFVRQDLLKRHMRVTHGIQCESAADRRKRMKITAEVNYWP